MGTAPAELAIERVFDLFPGRLRIATKQGLGCHDDPGQTIAALRRICGYQGPAHGRVDPRCRFHATASHVAHRCRAAIDRFTVDQDAAGPALLGRTSELRSRSAEISKNIQQRHILVHLHFDGLAVENKINQRHWRSLNLCMKTSTGSGYQKRTSPGNPSERMIAACTWRSISA